MVRLVSKDCVQRRPRGFVLGGIHRLRRGNEHAPAVRLGCVLVGGVCDPGVAGEYRCNFLRAYGAFVEIEGYPAASNQCRKGTVWGWTITRRGALGVYVACSMACKLGEANVRPVFVTCGSFMGA